MMHEVMMSRSCDITIYPRLPHEFARAQLMLIWTDPPAFITPVFQGMPGLWKGQHRLVLCWLIAMQAVSSGRKTLHEWARWSPRQITEWRLRRLLKASYWSVHLLIEWLAYDAIATFFTRTLRIPQRMRERLCQTFVGDV